jgi:hypothetical protein
MATTTPKTMTAAQMGWALRRGLAWEDPHNDQEVGRLTDTFWTREGEYQWDVESQRYEMLP